MKGFDSYLKFGRGILCVIFPLLVLYIVTLRHMTLYPERASVYIFVLVLIFLLFPLNRGKVPPRKIYSIIDLILIMAVIVTGMHLILDWKYIVDNMGIPRPIDIAMGITAILVTLEATRRTVWQIVPVVLAILLYAMFGMHLGGIMAAAPFDMDRLMTQIYLTNQGLYGIVLDIAIKYVIPFLIMGSLLRAMGAMDVLNDFVSKLVGRTAGGPAKISIATSGMFGMMSGSSVANVAFTGTFTIPLMKRYGYQDYFAGGVEACSSNGGQLMPPIMGASAFIMAEFIGVPYVRIMLAGLLPALLFYLAIFLRVHFKAKQEGLVKPSADIVGRIVSLREIIPRLSPLVIIFAVLLAGLFMWTPTRAAIVTIAVIIPLSFLRRESWLTPRKIIHALIDSTGSIIPIGAACVIMGLIVGVTGLTGLGLKVSELMLVVSRESLLLVLLVTFVACIIFGMGLASSAVYIFVSLMLAPALVGLGIPILLAHFFIFYYAQLSCITPPVCLCAYAAASIAKSNAMKTAFTALSLGSMGFILPFVFMFHPELLLEGSLVSTLITFSLMSIGLLGLTFALGGYSNRQLSLFERILFLILAIVIFIQWSYALSLAAVAIIGGLVLIPMIRRKFVKGTLFRH